MDRPGVFALHSDQPILPSARFRLIPERAPFPVLLSFPVGAARQISLKTLADPTANRF